jgi:GNAT superfamily N-acetyltransferase
VDIEAIERATVVAVAPPETLEIGGWLVPFDTGTIGRGKSAVPLSHDLDASALDRIFAAYAERGLPPAFRIAEVPTLERVRQVLMDRGLKGEQPTLVKTARSEDVAAVAVPFADLLEHPDDDWAAVFLGEGFDPADGAHRVTRLSQSPGALFGAVREGGKAVAVGALSFGYGWAGVHGMRTAADRRGSGFASRLLALFGSAALGRETERMFLQVEEANPARNLYRRAGFTAAWTYRYWR